jgi:acyl-CoA thioesterase-1
MRTPLLAALIALVTSAQAAPTAAPRYLALGDSFTIGTGSAAAEAFPARLVARWGCAVQLVNPARNGFTTQDLLDRELPVARELRPTLVTLAIGANDLVRGSDEPTYRQQLGRIFDGLAAAGVEAGRVVALPQPDWSRSPVASAFGEPAELRARIVRFNQTLREVSEARGARYVDLFPLMEAQARAGMVAGDGLHPSAAAYEAWAEALVKVVGSPCGGG